jgi:cytosine/adenosine deaminase-related metal-dependent hydrolase
VHLILRARSVWPVSAAAIDNGAVALAGNRIAAVGPWRQLSAGASRRVVDLGEVILLPGLVNAHCHLDYTHMAGQFPPPKAFSDWLKLITSTKAGWDLTDYAASWKDGAGMLTRTGTTTVGDIEAVPELLPGAWRTTPLRVISFLELIGITQRRPAATIVQDALHHGARLRHPRCRLGLSPHAPYSTLPELLRLSSGAARRKNWPLCTHVAESALEFAMFTEAKGDMYEWLRRSGRDMSDCGLGSPVQHLERQGVLQPRLVAAHVNHLRRGDASLLARRGVSVVHCPRSYEYFRHEGFSLKLLARAGVNVCLGTDSLASVLKHRRHVVELNLFEEMRVLAQREPWLSPRTIVRMGTLHGARALGLAGKIGQITPGAWADLLALPSSGRTRSVAETVLEHTGPISASMIDGHWALPPS